MGNERERWTCRRIEVVVMVVLYAVAAFTASVFLGINFMLTRKTAITVNSISNPGDDL